MRSALGLCLAAVLTSSALAGDDPMIREFESQGYRIRLHLKDQVLRLDAPDERDGFRENGAGPAEAPIEPRLPYTSGACLSAAALAEKAKQFDDGLYAAVEFAAQQGAGDFGGKAYLLKAVADHLGQHVATGTPDGAATTLFAAARLGEIPVAPPAGLAPQVTARIDAFQANTLRSKPIGFYNWSRSLEAIFRQDRMLQTELTSAAEIDALLAALAADRRATATYTGYLQLVERLTNPFVPEKPDLRALLTARAAGGTPAPDRGLYFFPPSRAHETELIKRLYGGRPIPDGFDLATEMIKGIRTNQLVLSPMPNSGWYDHQTWALVPLVLPEQTPEAARLKFGDEYQKQLIELFKGILARTRETHIKQLEIPELASAIPPNHDREPVVIRVQPGLTTEPLATYYLRRAATYRFIRAAIAATFGAAGMKSMKLWTPDGQSERLITHELMAMETLFVGAYMNVCQQIGLPPQLPDGPSPEAAAGARAMFSAWAADAAKDPDLGRDGRMMVPVFFDLERQKTKVWVFLGWSTKQVRVSYATEPRAEVFDAAGKPVQLTDMLRLTFDSESHALPYPVMAEVYVTNILNRAEFAAHCDQYKTRKAILENLK